MRKVQLLATVFGAALLVAAPGALAQQAGSDLGRPGGAGYGFTPPPGTPLTPHTEGGAGLIPPVGQQYDAARRAEAISRDVDALLRQADSAMARGNFALANEHLERAETELLNREAIAGGMTPQGSELQRQIAEARQALRNRDRAAAQQHVRLAMDMAARDAGAATGAGVAGMAPAHGGSGPGGTGQGGSPR